ncbi:MAG: DUF1566 domain-containing protein [Terracidiphilus sp.]
MNFWYKTSLVVLCLAAFDTQLCSAQLFSKDPAKWWPDPSTGLMWAEHGYSGNSHSILHPHGRTWQESVDYCAALKLGGFSGWRIPTLDEVKGIAYTRHGVVFTSSEPGRVCTAHEIGEVRSHCGDIVRTSDPQDWVTLKIPEWSADDVPFYTFVWTSTPTPDAEKPASWIKGPTVWIVGDGLVLGAIPKTWDMYNGRYMASLCVRPIDPDLLQIAKDAEVDVPVPDLRMLKAYVPLKKARLAHEAGQYQESITQARNALSIEPRLLTAYWGMGISYGMLGQWDLAIANLNSAYELDRMRGDVYRTLQWAKASKKAAKKGEKPKIEGKEWKNPEWKAPWS